MGRCIERTESYWLEYTGLLGSLGGWNRRGPFLKTRDAKEKLQDILPPPGTDVRILKTIHITEIEEAFSITDSPDQEQSGAPKEE